MTLCLFATVTTSCFIDLLLIIMHTYPIIIHLSLMICAYSASIIDRGVGFGTYYYDVEQRQACGSNFTMANTGVVECNIGALSLDDIDSNYVVAMNHTMLSNDLAKYCGRRVTVIADDGVQSCETRWLFIGDGCERCGIGSSVSKEWNPVGAPGLDFSYSVLSELSQNACKDGHIEISWEITDDIVYRFDTNSLESSS